MQRINSTDHLFHDADPFNGIQGTVVTAAWLNSVQEEIANAISAAGITLDPAQSNQLLAAIRQLAATVATQPVGDKSSAPATDAFVFSALGGIALVSVAGNTDVVLTQAQWGCAIIILTGALTGNVNLVMPTQGDQWKVVNRSTGSYSLTAKTAAGTGITLQQTYTYDLLCDGTNICSVNSAEAALRSVSADLYFLGQL
jgi:hypothetical protein